MRIKYKKLVFTLICSYFFSNNYLALSLTNVENSSSPENKVPLVETIKSNENINQPTKTANEIPKQSNISSGITTDKLKKEPKQELKTTDENLNQVSQKNKSPTPQKTDTSNTSISAKIDTQIKNNSQNNDISSTKNSTNEKKDENIVKIDQKKDTLSSNQNKPLYLSESDVDPAKEIVEVSDVSETSNDGFDFIKSNKDINYFFHNGEFLLYLGIFLIALSVTGLVLTFNWKKIFRKTKKQ